jgi:SPOR domain
MTATQFCHPILAAARAEIGGKLMNTRTRFLIGGVGALVPILLNLVVVDLETQLQSVTMLSVTSYLLRTCALFAVGGIVVTVFNSDEHVPAKLFQLGIVAPALLTALLNGHNVDVTKLNKPNVAARAMSDASTSAAKFGWRWPDLISSAYAQAEEKSAKQFKEFTLPDETPVQQITRGFFGTTTRNIWFVIAGSYLEPQNAERQAKEFHAKGFDAEVYLPWGDNKFYAVVIGAQMNLKDATALQAKAVKAGLPSDTFLWTFPQ